jgi:hypothetical protein
MPGSLQFSSGSLRGAIGGTILQCLASSSVAGSTPPPGVYHVQPPVQDAVYGQIAVMTLVGGAPGGPTGVENKKFMPGATGVENKKYMPGATAMKDWTPGANAWKDRVPSGAVGMKFWTPGGATMKYDRPSAVTQKWDRPGGGFGSVYVLSSRPIAGRNCIVIHSNFARLMDALNRERGATVVVA